MGARPAKVSVLIPYACPKCQYDVTRTLMDDITVCPECGGAISESTCGPPRMRMGPGASIGLATSILFGAFAFHLLFALMEAPSQISLRGFTITRDAVSVTMCGIVIAACEFACYRLWLSAERRRNRVGAAKRALARTAGVMLIQAAFMGSCVWIMVRAASV